MGRFEKEMASSFATAALDQIFADLKALQALRAEYEGGDTVPMAHLQRLNEVIGRLNEHSAEWLENLQRVLDEARNEAPPGPTPGVGTSTPGAPEDITPRRCEWCTGAGRVAGLVCGHCNGTGRTP